MLEHFEDLAESYYPGSRERRQTVPAARPPGVEEDVLGKGTWMEYHGVRIEFFSTGQAARAINRSAQTLRKWETTQVIPKTRYQTTGRDPDDDSARRRWYSRAQVMILIRLANKHGIMDANSRRPLDAFKKDVWAEFTALKKEAR